MEGNVEVEIDENGFKIVNFLVNHRLSFRNGKMIAVDYGWKIVK